MNWNEIKEQEKLCEIFKNNPLINPLTGRQIERGGPTYLEWQQKCGKPKKTGIVTYEKCNAFHKNPTINPDTGRKITTNGTVYKYWDKSCKNLEKKNEMIGDYYHPNSKGFVPIKLHDSKKYILRLDNNGRRVWGPLNLGITSSSEIKFVHFTETWDYLHKKYIPIFRNNTSNYYKSNKITQTQNKSQSLVENFFNTFLFE
jgi:hypothetical protein